MGYGNAVRSSELEGHKPILAREQGEISPQMYGEIAN